MDIFAEKFKSEQHRPGLISGVLFGVAGIFSWLRWFFTLTEEDRLAAGINVDGKDRLT